MDAADSHFVYIVLAEKRGTNRMADLEDDKYDKKHPGSRWHQCPRCSFWFDCLTEPSFANRPEEVPPSVNNGMVNLDVQGTSADTNQERYPTVIAQLTSGDKETNLSGPRGFRGSRWDK